jgi:tRNA-Thr(GGU) m(6)t(6)A37 methyltransferase TsaA
LGGSESPGEPVIKEQMMRTLIAIVVSCTALVVLVLAPRVMTAEEQGEKSFTVHSIGSVKKTGERTEIVLDKKYQEGLLGLDQWSHVQVLWWFDRNDTPQKRSILQVHPRGDQKNPLTGVFATRAPVRPNLIALSLCKVLAVKDSVIEVDKIDALEGTPVLDIKPYAPGIDMAVGVKVPDWARPR